MPSNPPNTVIVPGSKLIAGSECYEIVQELGRGGMGVVFQAIQRSIQRTVALKMLTVTALEDSQAMQRFLREGRICASLDHPNIVKVFGIVVTDEAPPFMVMELVQGRTLADMLSERKTLDEKAFVEVFDQVLSALQCAHDKGLIHRDIKPTNIMITTNGTIKVMDFGIAKSNIVDSSQQGITRTGAIVGSPSYMSPEQCTGSPIDARTDLYSVGCIMYESLVGTRPYSGDNPLEVMYKHINEPLNTDQVPIPMFSPLVCRALSKDTNLRYGSASDMRNDLHDGPAMPNHGKQSKRRPANKDRGKIAALIALALPLAIAAGLYLVPQFQNNQSQETFSARDLHKMGSTAFNKQYTTPSSAHSELRREALDFYERAAEQARKDGNANMEAEALLSQESLKPKEFAQNGEALYKKIDSLFSAGNSRTPGHAVCLISLSRWYLQHDQAQAALTTAERALVILRTLQRFDLKPWYIRNATLLCAASSDRLKDYEQSNRLFETAINGADTSTEPAAKHMIQAKALYAKSLREQGQFARSTEQIQQALALYKKCPQLYAEQTQPEGNPQLRHERDGERLRIERSDRKSIASLEADVQLNNADLAKLNHSTPP